jgi:hypothetical protein
MVSGLRCRASGIITRAQVRAKAKRAKYSRRRAAAVVEMPGAARVVVMAVLSQERTFCLG